MTNDDANAGTLLRSERQNDMSVPHLSEARTDKLEAEHEPVARVPKLHCRVGQSI